jgi:threonyl-tRNA synthetase
MVPIYYLKHEYMDYANNVKNILLQNNVQAEIFHQGNLSLNKIVRTNPNAYIIIIGNFEITNNNVCIRKNLGQVDNIQLDQLVDYIENFYN